jgi:hypothetical protein
MLRRLFAVAAVFLFLLLTTPNTAEACVSCTVRAGDGWHKAPDTGPWLPHEVGEGAHSDYENASCDDHGHHSGCGFFAQTLLSLWEALGVGDVGAVEEVVASSRGGLELNADRRSLQVLSCDGTTYLREFRLREAEFDILQTALD